MDRSNARIHLVTLTRVDSFLLDSLNLEWLKLLVEHLTQIHNDALMNFLPQVGTEDLDKRDLESWNLAMHEDARQVELHLETNVDIGSVDRRTPPEREATVGDLVQTRALGVRQLLVTHRLLETGRLLPEETLPSREVCSLEQRVLQDTFDTS